MKHVVAFHPDDGVPFCVCCGVDLDDDLPLMSDECGGRAAYNEFARRFGFPEAPAKDRR